PAYCIFEVTRGSAKQLKQLLGQARSVCWARERREKLESEGRGSEFREAVCPHCQATIDLTGYDASPEVHCEFCHTTWPADPTDQSQTKAMKPYRLCDECGMYSKPRRFTIFYFYFLLVVYGFSSRPTWRCPACMRGEAWKMLFGNLLFVIGVPVAIVQLVRAYGGTDVGGPLPGLDAANLKARNQRLEHAIADYHKILEAQPVSSGVKYNIGLAFLHNEDLEGAAKMLEYSLKDCDNFAPAAVALAGCYERLDNPTQLSELKRKWNAEESPEPGE
ncbi:MAG: hypothetical protein AAGF97_16470, partial [Planctomycetota bacterium]